MSDYIYQYKANLHFHSMLSDGAYTLKEIKKIINASEFDIVSLTDHNKIKNSLALYNSLEEELVILGIEISCFGSAKFGPLMIFLMLSLFIFKSRLSSITRNSSTSGRTLILVLLRLKMLRRSWLG